MGRPLDEMTFVSFDTETTGLSPARDRVVEIGAVRFDRNGRTIDTFQSLIHPKISIPPTVTAVHGITDNDVRGAPLIREVLRGFLQFIEGLDNILLAHNAMFDAGFIGAEMERCGIRDDGHLILDTLALSRRAYRGLSSFSLGSLARALAVDASGHHRALADSVMVKDIFLRILDSMPAVTTLDGLLDHCTIYRFPGLSRIDDRSVAGIELLQKALDRETPLLIVYRGGSKGMIPRKVTPLGVVFSQGYRYIRAYCHTDNIEKSFRVDKIERFAALEEEF